MDSLASSDGQKSMSFLTEINRIYWGVIWTRCRGRLAGNGGVEKTERADLNCVNTYYGHALDWNHCICFTAFVTLSLSVSSLASFAGLQRGDIVFFIWQDKASSIILPWKPHFSNPPLPLPVAVLSNDAQIDTLAPPPLPSPFLSLRVSLCSRLFPQMPPSLREYQINERDLSFLVIHQTLCFLHACPKYIQECPATPSPIDQWCNIHLYTPISP